MVDLSSLGITNVGHVFHNLSTPALYEEAIRRREGAVAHLGPLVVRTGQYTGRSAKDKFIVREASSEDKVWWGEHNKPFDPEHFELLKIRLQAYLQGRDVFVQDCYAGADPEYRLKLRVITETAWHSMFARDMFLREFDPEALARFEPDFVVLHCPQFHAMPEVDHTRSEAFILLNFAERLVIIGGTSYAGEIKKSVFTVMNYLLPQRGVLGMHSSANQGTDRGVFNFEGGCYAKVIRLSAQAEPEIHETTRRFGTILENVSMDQETRRLDLDDDSLTENTRAAYPVTHLPNIVESGMGGQPKNVIMLTADAFGVLPPIAKLTPSQAMYHFLSGYTAKVAGTEKGMGSEPQATFSTCFGAPFMPRHPSVYGNMLRELIARHKVDCWLVNTGWTGGKYGTGHRMPIKVTRALLDAALSGALKSQPMRIDPMFGFQVPTALPGIEARILNPRSTWADPAAYDAQARALIEMFSKNFAKFENHVDADVKA